MSPAIAYVPTVVALAGTAVTVPPQVTAIPAAATCSLTGTLPAGMTLTPACVLTGVPAASAGGTYTVTVTAANGVAPAFPATVTIQVDPPLAITSPAAATFIVGTADSFTVATTPFPYGVQLSETGPLPAGVTFNSGLLSGTPATGTAGVYHLTINAKGSQGSSASQAFTLTVDQIPVFTSPAKVTFTHGVRGTFTIRTTSFPVAHLTEQGTLPSGLSFVAGSGGTATISGTPSASTKGHTYVVNIIARNAANLTGYQQLTIVVR
jgi:hypothetical protein